MKRKKIITIILILLWMILVFCLSNQVADDSSKLSGRITQKIIEVLNLKEKNIETQSIIETIVRKLAHFTIYTLGGILILLHINLYKITDKRKKLISWIIGITYATTDEIHQLFIPGRSGEIRDVGIDSFGVIVGITILFIILKIIERRKEIGE